MTRLLLAGAALALASSAALAQGVSQIAQRLREGYEIKAAFYDNTGGAYVILQRGTPAYLCHSSPHQTCEKLN